MNKVKSFFLKTGDRSIFCTLIGDTSKVSLCTIIFLPLFEERMWSQRIAYNFAHNMLEKDQLVLMWDYYGYGESDGDSEDFTLKTCCQDLSSIMTYLKTEYGFINISFLGIRTGGSIACHVLSENSINIERLVLWAPVFDLKSFVFQSLRSTISTQSYIFKKIVANREAIVEDLIKYGKCLRDEYILNHIDGYRIGKCFYQEILSTGPAEIPDGNDLPILYVDIVPVEKEALFNKKKDEQQIKFSKYNNITYVIESDREFWLNGREYTQNSDKLYSLTTEWICL